MKIMKKMLMTTIGALFLAVAALAVACGGNEANTYKLTLDFDSAKGTVTASSPADGTEYAENEEITITVTAKENYEIDQVTVAGQSVTLTSGAYTFKIVSDTTVKATFKDKTVTPVEPEYSFGSEYVGTWKAVVSSDTLGGYTLTITADSLKITDDEGKEKSVSINQESGKTVITLDEADLTLTTTESEYVLALISAEGDYSYYLNTSLPATLKIAESLYGHYVTETAGIPDLILSANGIEWGAAKVTVVKAAEGSYVLLVDTNLYSFTSSADGLTLKMLHSDGASEIKFVSRVLPELDFEFDESYRGNWVSLDAKTLEIGVNTLVYDGTPISIAEYFRYYFFHIEEEGDEYRIVNYSSNVDFPETQGYFLIVNNTNRDSDEEPHIFFPEGTDLSATIEDRYLGEWKLPDGSFRTKIEANKLTWNYGADGAEVSPILVDLGEIESFSFSYSDERIVVGAHCYLFMHDGELDLLYWDGVEEVPVLSSMSDEMLVSGDWQPELPEEWAGVYHSLNDLDDLTIEGNKITLGDVVGTDLGQPIATMEAFTIVFGDQEYTLMMEPSGYVLDLRDEESNTLQFLKEDRTPVTELKNEAIYGTWESADGGTLEVSATGMVWNDKAVEILYTDEYFEGEENFDNTEYDIYYEGQLWTVRYYGAGYLQIDYEDEEEGMSSYFFVIPNSDLSEGFFDVALRGTYMDEWGYETVIVKANEIVISGMYLGGYEDDQVTVAAEDIVKNADGTYTFTFTYMETYDYDDDYNPLQRPVELEGTLTFDTEAKTLTVTVIYENAYLEVDETVNFIA